MADGTAERGYHHGDLRRALLDTVGTIVQEGGLDALSLRECARRAGVSPGAPAHHFGDKRGLLTEFALEGLGALRADVQHELGRAGSAHDAVRAIGLAYIRTALSHPAHFRVMFRRELLNAEDGRLEAGSVFALLKDRIADLDRERGLEPRQVEERAFFAWSTVHGFVNLLLDASSNPHVAYDGDPAAGLARAEGVLEQVMSALLAEA
ncbi:MAG: TetR/AcrR family transcriptional regulator [Planctomycetota bacterium]